MPWLQCVWERLLLYLHAPRSTSIITIVNIIMNAESKQWSTASSLVTTDIHWYPDWTISCWIPQFSRLWVFNRSKRTKFKFHTLQLQYLSKPLQPIKPNPLISPFLIHLTINSRGTQIAEDNYGDYDCYCHPSCLICKYNQWCRKWGGSRGPGAPLVGEQCLAWTVELAKTVNYVIISMMG